MSSNTLICRWNLQTCHCLKKNVYRTKIERVHALVCALVCAGYVMICLFTCLRKRLYDENCFDILTMTLEQQPKTPKPSRYVLEGSLWSRVQN